MYGTVARIRPKSGKQAEIVSYVAQWNKERKPHVPGALAAYVLTPDDPAAEMQIIAVFADKETYVANANDPEQDRWHSRLRALLDREPDWQDGAIDDL